MDILSVEQSRFADKVTVELCNTNNRTLIYKAASAVFEVLREEFAPLYTKKIVLVCGKGNNGADGLALALILKKANIQLAVLLAEEESALSADGRHYLKLLRQVKADIQVVTKYNISVAEDVLRAGDIIVDALLGTGLNRAVSGLYQTMIRLINMQCDKQVLSIDIPSGINGNNGRVMGEAVRSGLTVVMQHLKLGNVLGDADDHTAHRVVKDIGILSSEEAAARLLVWKEVAQNVAERRYNVNKYHHGSVLVFGGSQGMEGAAVLSAAAALRSGAGLVSIAAMPESLSRIGALSSAEVMVDGIHDGADLTAMLRKKSIVVAGMGLKDDERAREYIKMLLETPLPLVLDAGALKIIKELQNEMKARQQSTVLTPHAGELAALLDISGEEVYDAPIDCAKQAAERFHSIVVLKMNKTIITDGMHRTMISDNKNKGMATAGSGDVLSGIIAANIAASSDVFHRVCMGVHLHAVAGRYAAKVNGQRYMNAGDIIIGLKEAQQELFEG